MINAAAETKSPLPNDTKDIVWQTEYKLCAGV